MHQDQALEDKPENYFIMTYVLTHEDGQHNLKLFKRTIDQTQFRKNRKAKKIQY